MGGQAAATPFHGRGTLGASSSFAGSRRLASAERVPGEVFVQTGRVAKAGVFVLVSGPPASGKSTLAPLLAERLSLPLVAKDTIKDAFMSVMTVPDVKASRQLGRAAVAAMLAVAAQSPIGAVIESNFHRSVARAELQRLPGRIVEVFCRCDAEVAHGRYQARVGTRQGGHFDEVRRREELWNGEVCEPVAGGWPVLEVDTNKPVDVAAVVAFIRGVTGEPSQVSPPSAGVATPIDVGVVVPAVLRAVPGVSALELRGSRQRGEAGRFSDWDFVIGTTDFPVTARELPAATAVVRPLAAQWDRLSDEPCFMLILHGPVKVDVIFDGLSQDRQPPWTVDATTLTGIDAHFWDWVLWLASKADAGKTDVVQSELAKMHEHLLAPLGTAAPTSLLDAVRSYRSALAYWEKRLGISVDRRLAHEADLTMRLLRP